MKIISLDLERYGPFTGQTLAFQPEAKLHIVYGRNEAGKSCSLAAVTDLFFGIDARTRYDFLHDAKDLRVGATIEAHDGTRLTFQRRKGNKNTLLASAGSALSDDALLPFLGSLNREIFCHAFGLNTQKLRAGAEEMLKSDGEVGASLFAAASGLRGLSDLRHALDADAANIFDKRYKQDRTFYQAHDRFEEARKSIRELELKTADWKSRNERIEELSVALAQVKETRGQNVISQTRLSRLKRVAPLLRLIDTGLAALNALGDLPELPLSFTGRLRDGLTAFTKSKEESERAATDLDRAQRDFEEIAVDEALIAKAGDIERLFGETTAYANDRRDMPRIRVEADDYSGTLGQLAVRLGMLSPAEVEQRQPSDAVQALVRNLITEGKKLSQAVATRSAGFESEAAALASLEDHRGDRGDLVDPGPLNDKFAAFSSVLKQAEKRSEIERSLTAESRSLAQAAARLDPAVTDLGALAKASLPSVETIARFRRQIDETAEYIRAAAGRAEAATSAIVLVKAKLQSFSAGAPVPSADAINIARTSRDEAWIPLRGALTSEVKPLAAAVISDTVDTFERHKADADRLADAAVADAERVADYNAETRRLSEEQDKEAAAKSDQTRLAEENRKLEEDWRATWTAAGIAPLPPSEMALWLASVKSLLERAEKRDLLQDDLDGIDSALAGITPALEALADEIGQPRALGLAGGVLAEAIDAKLKAIAAGWDTARDLETSIRDTQSRIAKSRTAEQDARNQLEAWGVKWEQALSTLGLMSGATVEEADAALGAWKEVPAAVRERDNRERRVTGMKRNIDEFEMQALSLAETVAPDVLSLPLDVAIKTLSERLTAARAADARRVQANKRLADTTRARDAAADVVKNAEAEILAVGELVPKGINLSELLYRLVQKEEWVAKLAERRTQLAEQGDGFSEDQLRTELSAFDPDQAEATLRELAGEDERLNSESQEQFAERDRLQRELATLEQGVGAEVALQQRRNAEAEMLEAAREWAVLKLGAMLVGKVIDRHRASQQDPLMVRAGALFTTLTGGVFSGLGQDFDDDDAPRIIGRRSSGETVPVMGLSEGTRDQLYLALRLAYLEEYAGRAETAPFIGDDLFTSFDEDRTANGIAALAAIGGRVQPILFTHHKHVVEIARSTAGSKLDVIELA